MNCDYVDAGLALLKAKRQAGDVDSELAHAIRDYCGGADSVPEYLAEAIGAVQAELKARVRRTWHESKLAELQADAKEAEREAESLGCRIAELVAELSSARQLLDSIGYDVGELPARLALGEVPAAASLIRALPDIRAAVRDADSVLGDNA